MSPSPNKIRLATVGTGYFSRFQYAAWARMPEVELVGICNRSAAAAQEVADQYGKPPVFEDFEQMLDQVKPDLVDIITPPVTHSAYVRAAVDRNIVTICQKPFTPSLEEASNLVDYIEAKKGRVIIHENFRFQPWYLKLKDLLDQNLLGQLYEISFALRPGDGQGPEAYMDRQPYFQQMERLLVHETAVHLIDVFRYLFGEVSALYARLRRVNPVIKGEDAGLIVFDFTSGAAGLFDGNRLSDHKAENRRRTMGEMRIEGEKGCLSLDGDGRIFFRRHGENQETRIDYDWQDIHFGGDCVYALQRHVVDHLITRSPVVNTAAEYLTNVRLADAAYRSDTEGRRIEMT